MPTVDNLAGNLELTKCVRLALALAEQPGCLFMPTLLGVKISSGARSEAHQGQMAKTSVLGMRTACHHATAVSLNYTNLVEPPRSLRTSVASTRSNRFPGRPESGENRCLSAAVGQAS